MADSRKGSRHVLVVLCLCIIWYIVSSSNNVIGKMVLSEFPYPMTVTMVQLTSITVYSGPFFNLWGIRKHSDMPWNYFIKIILPLAFGKFFASVTSHISIWKVPVSYAHTVKATMPFFTVILSRIILKERQTLWVYLSLIPIISGVGIATVTELSFNMLGLICALVSTMGFSLQNIFSKKVLKDTSIHHLRLLHVLGKWALIMFLPIWMYVDFTSVINHTAMKNLDYRVIALLFADGVLNWLQNIIAFSVLSLVPSLTYAVASASKRIFVIGVSLFILGNPVTWVNMLGMSLAVVGVLCYNRAKHMSKQQIALPYTNSEWIKYNPLHNAETFYQNGKPYTNGHLSNGYKNDKNLLFNNNNSVHTGTIKRDRKKGQSVDLQINMSREELEMINASALAAEVTKAQNLCCVCTRMTGFHVLLLFITCLPFVIVVTSVYSFYIGTLAWYNMFTYFNEEKPFLHKLLMSPVLILAYPFAIVLCTLGLGMYAGCIQLSVQLTNWINEIDDIEKGFYGWLCSILKLADCSPYEVVILTDIHLPEEHVTMHSSMKELPR